MAGRSRSGGGSPWGRGVRWLWVALAGVVAVGLLRPRPLSGQSDSGLLIAAGSHSLTVPWYLSPVGKGFNPAVMVGAERALRSGERWRLALGVNLGFLRDHWWMTGFSFEPEIRLGRILPGGFQADLGLGVGYMHYVWRRRTLELENARYVEAARRGHPSLLVPLSATIRYRGRRDAPLAVSPFVTARWGAQLLFLDEVPLMTHLSLMGGVRIRRGRKEGGGV